MTTLFAKGMQSHRNLWENDPPAVFIKYHIKYYANGVMALILFNTA